MDDMLVGWDEIAAYLKVSVKTAQRWEKDGHMPIVRLFCGSVRASRKEIKYWIVRTNDIIESMSQDVAK